MTLFYILFEFKSGEEQNTLSTPKPPFDGFKLGARYEIHQIRIVGSKKKQGQHYWVTEDGREEHHAWVYPSAEKLIEAYRMGLRRREEHLLRDLGEFKDRIQHMRRLAGEQVDPTQDVTVVLLTDDERAWLDAPAKTEA